MAEFEKVDSSGVDLLVIQVSPQEAAQLITALAEGLARSGNGSFSANLVPIGMPDYSGKRKRLAICVDHGK